MTKLNHAEKAAKLYRNVDFLEEIKCSIPYLNTQELAMAKKNAALLFGCDMNNIATNLEELNDKTHDTILYFGDFNTESIEDPNCLESVKYVVGNISSSDSNAVSHFNNLVGIVGDCSLDMQEVKDGFNDLYILTGTLASKTMTKTSSFNNLHQVGSVFLPRLKEVESFGKSLIVERDLNLWDLQDATNFNIQAVLGEANLPCLEQLGSLDQCFFVGPVRSPAFEKNCHTSKIKK